MAINLNNAKTTIDFEYQDDDITLFVRFHHTEEFDETVSLSNDKKDYLNFPAKMFLEVADFLKSKNLVKDFKSVEDKKEQGNTLPIPKVKKNDNSQENKPSDYVYEVEGEPFESFYDAQIDNQINKKTYRKAETDAKQEEESEETNDGEISEEEAQEMIKERMLAAERAKNNKKTIKKIHKMPE